MLFISGCWFGNFSCCLTVNGMGQPCCCVLKTCNFFLYDKEVYLSIDLVRVLKVQIT